MGKISLILSNPLKIYDYASAMGLTKLVPDEPHLKLMYKCNMGYGLPIDNPITFNEKLQWLKLHDRNPLYTTLVDKCGVKQWVGERIGYEHVPKTYGVWDSPENISLDNLPEKFVLKTNHDSSGAIICRDKNEFDLNAAKKELKSRLSKNYFWRTREWPYKNVKPLVFAEELLEQGGDGSLDDYKFFCFNGIVDCVMLCLERETGDPKFYFLDREWNVRPYNKRGRDYGSSFCAPEPNGLDKAFDYASKLSRDFPFVRVDFYLLEGQVRFGEMTFYPQAGFDPNILPEADKRWGSMINLGLAFDSRAHSAV